MIFAAAGALLGRFLEPLLIGGMVACVATIGVQAWKLKSAREDAATARAQLATLKEALAQAHLKAAADAAEQIEAKRKVEIQYATDKARLTARLADAERLLRAERARASLRPAQESPAPCRAYAAAPTQLSESDAVFLVREADRADRIAVQLNRLIDYVEQAYGPIPDGVLNDVSAY